MHLSGNGLYWADTLDKELKGCVQENMKIISLNNGFFSFMDIELKPVGVEVNSHLHLCCKHPHSYTHVLAQYQMFRVLRFRSVRIKVMKVTLTSIYCHQLSNQLSSPHFPKHHVFQKGCQNLVQKQKSASLPPYTLVCIKNQQIHRRCYHHFSNSFVPSGTQRGISRWCLWNTARLLKQWFLIS